MLSLLAKLNPFNKNRTSNTDREVYEPKTEDLSYLNKSKMEESDDPLGCETLEQEEVHFKVDSATEITRVEILDFGNEGFILKNLLTTAESDYVISQGESIGFSNLLLEYSRNYRNNDRVMLRSPHLADVLWSRVLPYLNDINVEGDPTKVHVHGSTRVMQGKWIPYRVNPVFRLCKYNPGGHFAPHCDGNFVVSSIERTMQTLMLYLNSEFQGGTTNFVDEQQPLFKSKSGKKCADAKNILNKIQPEKGMAIIFNHHRLHEGEAVRDGTKYILRTDIIFRKVDTKSIDPTEEKAHLMVQEAEKLEKLGQSMEAMELYRKAYKLCPSLEDC